MFLADVAMGKPYYPTSSCRSLPSGYNSMFAKAGQSGVLNNEMIVYNLFQASLKFLVEFSG
jgi:poly [ADP-ribose] polymerase